jgi:hypothetical protein
MAFSWSDFVLFCRRNTSVYVHGIKNSKTTIFIGDYIDNIHKEWWGDYKRLEEDQMYMHW